MAHSNMLRNFPFGARKVKNIFKRTSPSIIDKNIYKTLCKEEKVILVFT